MNLKTFDRVISISQLETIERALLHAENEIHNPGAARAENFDLLDLIDQAQQIIKRTILENAAMGV